MKVRSVVVMVAAASALFLAATVVVGTSLAQAAVTATPKVWGPFQLKNALNNMCLDMDISTNGANGSAVQLRPCTADRQPNQDWYFEGTSTVGLYRVHTRYNYKCLEASTTIVNGTKPQVGTCASTNLTNPYWNWNFSPSKTVNLYTLSAFFGGQCLDLNAKTATPATATVTLWHCHGSRNQDWYDG